jgi:HEAT repeat protein
MRRITLLTCLALLLAGGLLLAQPGPDKDALTAQIESLTAKKKEVRLAALKKIGNYGRPAASAVAELGKCMEEDPDDKVATRAARALAQIGPAAVPELARGARHEKKAVRGRALWALGLMGPDAKGALDVLKDALKDPQPDLRVRAAYALGELGPEAEPAIPPLCQSLRDRDPKVRTQAAGALRDLGAVGLPSIRELLGDDDADVRLSALQAAMVLGPDAKDAVTDIAKLLQDDAPKLRIAAADALGSIGPDAKDAIPGLTSVMRDKNGDVQKHAFQAILQVGSADIPGLLETMRKLNAEWRWAFPYILRQFGPKAKDAVKPLIKQLESPDDGTRMSAALALAQIGKEARDAIAPLQKLVKNDPNPMVRHSAAFACQRISADPQAEHAKQMQAAVEQIERNVKQAVAPLLAPKQWRPLNRQALFDPQIQAQYNQIMDVHLLASVQSSGNSLAKARLNPDFWGVPPEMAAQAAQLISQDPEAAPAFIRAIHLTAYYDLGFC